MKTAYLRLVFRPVLLFWLLWMVTIVSLPLKSEHYRVLANLIGPGLTGMLLGQIARDAMNRFFSWHLPSIRSRMVVEFGIVVLVCCTIFAFLLPINGNFFLPWLLALISFSLGSLIKTAQYTLFDVKATHSSFSVLSLILLGVYLNVVIHWAESHLILTTVISLLVSSTCFWVTFQRKAHRKTLFEMNHPMVSSFNTKAVVEFQKMRLSFNKKPNRMKIPGDLHKVNQLWGVTPYILFESSQGMPWATFMRNMGIGVLFISLFTGYLVHKERFSFFLWILIFILTFQFPLTIKEKLLHPISRFRKFKINYLGCLLEDLFYVLVPIVLFWLIDLIHFPELHFETGNLAFFHSQNLFSAFIIAMLLVPIVQFIRRRFGFSLPVYMLTITSVIFLEFLMMFLVSYWNLGILYAVLVSVALIFLTQILLYLRLKDFYLKGDARFDCF